MARLGLGLGSGFGFGIGSAPHVCGRALRYVCDLAKSMPGRDARDAIKPLFKKMEASKESQESGFFQRTCAHRSPSHRALTLSTPTQISPHTAPTAQRASWCLSCFHRRRLESTWRNTLPMSRPVRRSRRRKRRKRCLESRQRKEQQPPNHSNSILIAIVTVKCGAATAHLQSIPFRATCLHRHAEAHA